MAEQDLEPRADAPDSGKDSGKNVGKDMAHDADSTVDEHPQPVLINEVQLILAEKRTSLATLRTGIAILALPMSVLSLLVATSKYYSVWNVLDLLVPLTVLNLGLIALSTYLITRALKNIVHQDRMIKGLKARHHRLAKFLD